MVISLDTNIWIFGLFNTNPFCRNILLNLTMFDIIVPNQIRAELERNLPKTYIKEFYSLTIEAAVRFDFEGVPEGYITKFEEKGLKKGDAIIGAYCEWRKVDMIVSDNRDFLRGLSGGHYFEVVSPQEFCEKFGL